MSRDITQCHPKLQELAKKLVDECARQGLKIKITECLRTVKEQDDLYAQGRTKPGNIVTNAKGSTYSSLHMWGIAFDICRNDGKGAYYNDDRFFQKVGAIGQKLGLEWGGSFKSIVDLPHFQMPNWGSTSSKLKSQYGTPNEFMKTWKTTTNNPSSTTLKVGSKGEDVKKLQTMLNACGFNCGNPDGIFGSGTETAVKAMQKHFGITQDGIYGTTSKSKLESMYNTNGLANSSINGIWYYNKHGKPDTSYTGLAQNKNGWFYIKKGQVDFSYNGLVKNDQGWWAVHKGKVDFNYNGFESNDQGMWYCEKGKITFNKTDVIKDSKTGIWWNVIKSKVTPGITVAKNVNGWWYIDKNGKVDFTFNGLAKNQYGTWVIEKGKVNFNYNGKYTYNGKNYNIKDGKVI